MMISSFITWSRRWPALILLALLSFGLFSVELKSEDALTEPVVPIAKSPVSSLPELPPLHEFDQIVARTLFSVSRKPPVKIEGPSGGNKQELLETWKLTGVTITDDRALALFQERNGSKRLRLETGMPLDNRWQLEEVKSDSVIVASGDQLVEMVLRQPRDPLKTSTNETKAPAKGAQGSDSTTSERKRNQAHQSAPQRRGLETM